jgi:hypothetical protein
VPGSGFGGGWDGREGQRSVRDYSRWVGRFPKKTLLREGISAGRESMTHLYRRVTRVWLDSADILDVSTCDDRRPRARSSLWPVGLWPVRVRLGFLSGKVGCSGPLEQSSFSRVGAFRSLRHCSPAQLYRRHHDHNLAPTLVDQAYRTRRGRSARRRCPRCQGGACR